MKVTGHTRLSTLQKYDKGNPLEASKQIADLQNKGKGSEADAVAKPKPKVKVLDYLFAESTLLRLDKLRSQEVNIKELPELHKAVNVIKNLSTIDKAKAFLDSIDKMQLYDRIKVIGDILWYIGRKSADAKLYQLYEHKVIELGLSDSLTEITDEDLLHQLWQQDFYNEQEEL